MKYALLIDTKSVKQVLSMVNRLTEVTQFSKRCLQNLDVFKLYLKISSLSFNPGELLDS